MQPDRMSCLAAASLQSRRSTLLARVPRTFAAELFVRSQPFQKQNERALQELSTGPIL